MPFATFFLALFLSLPAYAAESAPQPWATFEPQWMQVFGRDSVQIVDKGAAKTYILDQGVTATFLLESGNVQTVRIFYVQGAPVRYMKGIQQTIRTMLGKSAESADLINQFQTAKPTTLHKQVSGVCLERTKDDKLGWIFQASYSQQCPNFIK